MGLLPGNKIAGCACADNAGFFSIALGQSYDSFNEITLKDMDKMTDIKPQKIYQRA